MTSQIATYDADVLVVGGGPAGSMAGLTLARRGVSTVLLDKKVFPRDKPCGGGIRHGVRRRFPETGCFPEIGVSLLTTASLAPILLFVAGGVHRSIGALSAAEAHGRAAKKQFRRVPIPQTKTSRGETMPKANLVSRVFAAREFDQLSQAVLDQLAAAAPSAIAATKTLFYKLDALDFLEGISAGIIANADARSTPAFREGVQRFTSRKKDNR